MVPLWLDGTFKVTIFEDHLLLETQDGTWVFEITNNRSNFRHTAMLYEVLYLFMGLFCDMGHFSKKIFRQLNLVRFSGSPVMMGLNQRELPSTFNQVNNKS
jgi:hypothetical protein